MESTASTDIKNAACALFRTPFETFMDHGPGAGASRTISCGAVGAMFAHVLSTRVEASAFGNGALERATKFVEVAGPYVASTEFKRVIDYIVKEPTVSLDLPMLMEDIVVEIYKRKTQLELDDLTAAIKKAHGRFIDEMSIEFNQIEDREGALLHDDLQDPRSAVEYLKSEYHSTWRNNRDFEWIAKDMPDFRREYAKLNSRYTQYWYC